MKKTFIYILLIGLCFCIEIQAQEISSFTLPTPWTQTALNAETPLPEYPRPQMVRSEWKNLNGTWEYMGGNNLTDPTTSTQPPQFINTAKIKVPFPPESELSGIAKKNETFMWYRREFSIPKEWKGKQVLLHFGAVDRIATIFINGEKIGTHTGGYDSFHFNITSHLKSGNNELVVGAYDPNDGKAACGKNSPRGDYTYTSGIWQTVWIEPVEEQYISHFKITTDLPNNRILVIPTVYGENNKIKITAEAYNGETLVAQTSVTPKETLFLTINQPHLWSPDDPFLYGLKLTLTTSKGKIIDKIDSYFGMRSIEIKKIDGINRPVLNGEFVFHIGLLDQGYWPDGIFTAPTDEALAYDIKLAKNAGFNVIRKHIKVEPQRWYYHCDKLGLMVWQDMPNLWEPDGADSTAIRSQFRKELKTMIDQHYNAPSIVMWVPFNENWGAFEVTDITEWTKKYDCSRLVNGLSGFNYAPGYRPAYGDPGNGDFVDMHHYGNIESNAMPKPDEKRAASLGEFGGKGLFVRGHLWPVPNNAYEMMLNKNILTDTYVLMMNQIEQMIKYEGLSAAIYTQTTDVEHEINGLVTYDRQIEKMILNKVKDINQDVIKCTRKKP